MIVLFPFAVSLDIGFQNLIQHNQELHQRILLYEPIWFELLKSSLKESKVNCSTNELIDYLDEKISIICCTMIEIGFWVRNYFSIFLVSSILWGKNCEIEAQKIVRRFSTRSSKTDLCRANFCYFLHALFQFSRKNLFLLYTCFIEHFKLKSFLKMKHELIRLILTLTDYYKNVNWSVQQIDRMETFINNVH